MKFRTSSRDSPEINLTALIDVVFLLLIFFMVSTTFEWRSELSIQLPEASARASTGDDAVVDVVIDAEGRVYVEGRPLDGLEARNPAACPCVRRAEPRLTAGSHRRRRANPASGGRHGHGCRTPSRPLQADLRGAALRGAGTLTYDTRNFEPLSRPPLAAGIHRACASRA